MGRADEDEQMQYVHQGEGEYNGGRGELKPEGQHWPNDKLISL